jgi:hypothetical protein
MRHPVMTAFAMVSFIGAAGLAMACGKDAPEIEPIVGKLGTEPAVDETDAEAPTKTVTVPTKPKKEKKDAAAPLPPAPVDAGPPPSGDDDDDDDDDDDNVLQADCPQDQTHMMAYLMASMGGGGGTSCTSGGNECNTNECCMAMAGPGICLPE